MNRHCGSLGGSDDDYLLNETRRKSPGRDALLLPISGTVFFICSVAQASHNDNDNIYIREYYPV